MSTYLDRVLGERESILMIARQHWLVLFQHILPEVLLIIALIVFVSLGWAKWVESPLAALGYLLLLLPVISLVRDVLIWGNHRYVVTTHRVIQIMGIVNKSVIDSSLEKVNDVKMEQSFFGRIFGYGDVEILTASELGVNRFTRIGDPVRFKTSMLNAKTKLESEAIVVAAAPGVAAAGGAAPDIPALIAQLDALRKQGVLTDAEFEQKKAQLLAKL